MGEYTLCVSTEILLEYQEVLAQQYSVEFAEAVINAISTADNVEFVNPSYHFNLIPADEDDNKFVDCAITAGATYIVTNDHHFDALKQIDFPHVEVKTLREFKELLKSLTTDN